MIRRKILVISYSSSPVQDLRIIDSSKSDFGLLVCIEWILIVKAHQSVHNLIVFQKLINNRLFVVMQRTESYNSSCSKITLNTIADNEFEILDAHASRCIRPLISILY